MGLQELRDSWEVWRRKINEEIGHGIVIDALNVLFNPSHSTLVSKNVQSAIDELDSKKINSNAVSAVGKTGQYGDLVGAPELATVATTGSYNDLSDKPSIPSAQVQSDWGQTDNTKVDYIKNKPSIPDAQVQSDWGQTDNTKVDYIKNKPTLGTASAKNSTDAVTQNSTDLVESGAVYTEVDSVKQALTTYENVCGAKNLFKLALTTQISLGITYTANADGTVQVSGSVTSGNVNSYMDIGTVSLKAGQTYKITGCPSGGSDSLYALRLYSGNTVIKDFGEGGTYTPGSDTDSAFLRIIILPAAGTVNLTFSPMVRVSSIGDDTYVAYAMTNRDLTQVLTNVAPIENGTNYSKTYGKGSQFIRDGKLYTVTVDVNTSTTITVGTNCKLSPKTVTEQMDDLYENTNITATDTAITISDQTYTRYIVKNGICFWQIQCSISDTAQHYFTTKLPQSLFGNYIYSNHVSNDATSVCFLRIASDGTIRVQANTANMLFTMNGCFPIHKLWFG